MEFYRAFSQHTALVPTTCHPLEVSLKQQKQKWTHLCPAELYGRELLEQ